MVKKYLPLFVISLASMAIANRVAFVKNIVNPNS